jgi:hypothetical protein
MPLEQSAGASQELKVTCWRDRIKQRLIRIARASKLEITHCCLRYHNRKPSYCSLSGYQEVSDTARLVLDITTNANQVGELDIHVEECSLGIDSPWSGRPKNKRSEVR